MTVATADIRALMADLADRPVESVLQSLRQGGKWPAVLDTLCESAERAAISDLAGSLATTQALVCIADAAGERGARVRRARAQALSYANRFAEAERTLAEGIALAEANDDQLEAAQCRLMSLHALARQGRFDEAVAMGEAAHEAFARAGESFHAARADINLGVTYRMKDEPAAALAMFERALPAVGERPLVLAQLQSNRAEALLDLHRFGEAHAAFCESLAAFERAGAKRAAAIVEGNLADLCGRQGRLDESLEHFERARRALGEADAPGDAARLEVERAEALLSLGLADEAERAFLHAIPTLRERGMAFEAARAQAGVGRALLARKRFAQACAALVEANARFAELSHPTGSNRAHLLLARALLGAGQAGPALDALRQLSNRPDLKPVERAEMLACSAVALSHAGDASAAWARIEEAIGAAENIGLPVLLAEFHQHKAWIRERAGDSRGALAALESALDMVERVRSGLRAERYRAVFSGAFTGAYDEYVSLWLDCGGEPAHALDVIERGRARALLDALGAGPLFSGIAEAHDDDVRLLRRRAELHAMIAAAHARLDSAAGPGATAAPAEIEAQLTDVELRLAATRRFAGDFAPPPGAAKISEQVPAASAMVEFFNDRGDVSALVVRDGNTRVVRSICESAQVKDRLGALRLQLSIAVARGLTGGLQGAARAEAELSRLGSLLLEPIWPCISGANQLAVIADGDLTSVPFHALKAGGTWMIDAMDVVTAPSAAVMCRLAERRTGSGHHVVIGVSDEHAPYAEKEAASVASATGASHVLLGPDATTERVRNALQGACGVHIASHARFVAQSPMQSAFKLADGWFTARDLYDVELAGGTVVMSACESGRSGVSHGRELLGLVRALMSAGAGALVLSQWLLHDEIAAQLLTKMYTIWYGQAAGGRRPAAALRAAQQRIRAQQPHVAAWGSLYVVGGLNRGDS